MTTRSVILSMVSIAFIACAVWGQSTVRKKTDPVVKQQTPEGPDFGDKVYVVNDVAGRIPDGLVRAILRQPRKQFENDYKELLSKPKIIHLGWSHRIQKIEDSEAGVTVTVRVSPRITTGTSTTVLSGIEAVYHFRNGELSLVSSRVKGAPRSYITD